MGDLWRSEYMTLLQLFIPVEAAHDVIESLGQLGLVQFVDLNTHVMAHNRSFVPELKRLGDLQFKLNQIVNQIQATNSALKLLKGKKNVSKEELVRLRPISQMKPEEKEINADKLETILEDIAQQMGQLNQNKKKLDMSYQQIQEMQAILGKDEEGFFTEVGTENAESSDEEMGDFNLDELGPVSIKAMDKRMSITDLDDETLRFLTGVIPREKFSTFEKVVYRQSKGLALMRYRELEEDFPDPETKLPTQKNSFIVFYRGGYLGEKITKIAAAFDSHVYPCPQKKKERKTLRKQLKARGDELSGVIEMGVLQMKKLMTEVALTIDFWHHFLLKEIAIYHTLNQFNFDHGKTLIGECWCPNDSIEVVKAALAEGKKRAGSTLDCILTVIETKQEPPTYFKTNKFTKVFQKIVDSYGIARYREVNPAVFTVITFPWQFGIMFGDFGHGFLLLLFSLYFVWKEKDWEGKPMNEMLAWPYKGRYLLLLMAAYSMWMGALYNECFSVTMDFGSNWVPQFGPGFTNSTFQQKNPTPSGAYAFGVDPVWKGATNELLYYNSMKMKVSIIVGVLQMTVGLFLHLLNALEFKNPLDIWFEFVPRFLFLEAIFGYLCFMIFYKWCVDWMGRDMYNAEAGIYGSNATGVHTGTSGSPGLLNELIYMFLPGGPADNLYTNQSKAQTALVIIAFVSIPFMLFPKPLVMKYQHGKKATIVNDNIEKRESESDDSINELEGGKKEDSLSKPSPIARPVEPEEEEFQFGELMIHQLLETIEFVLGSVSHTASYLRLWALSLAHSELATVFWYKIMFQLIDMTKEMNPGIIGLATFAAYSVWWIVTLLVMMFMELLSALLHALRLHWVEFQSKFYKGDGYPFTPFAMRKVYTANRLPDVTKGR
eukprot:TRINITY_DN3954_c0_g1_i1.p1 TRINITY_DN3954_c0_g1~~TRINITY_DN3954_c0_g1_i1.p1  ORF type:complete len:887 (+),score=213.85 TRINITY_DN3954_c0_g1_i1:133-2793(+)